MGACSIGIAAVIGFAVARAEDPLVVEFADARTNYFAGRNATFGIVVRGGGAVDGTICWVLTVGNRPLVRGSAAVRHAGDDPTRVDVMLSLPEVREGLVVDATLSASLVDSVGEQRGGKAKKVRFFPPDPFTARRHWLESRRMALFDPVGRTAAAFETAGVPFAPLPKDLDIAQIRPSVIVIGEGVSWGDRPGLPRQLAVFAARGLGVLCLAPRDGEMPLPGTADEPGEVVAKKALLRRADVVAEFDDRLDWRAWSAAGDTIVSRFTVAADGEAVLLRVGDGPAGWPWLEAAFARRETEPPAGTIIVCGLGIVAHWDETPAAKYLFAALLQRLSQNAPVPSVGDPAVAPPQNKDFQTDPTPETEP